MKSVNELQLLLKFELVKHYDAIKTGDNHSLYQNSLLGNTSILLAGLLGLLMKEHYPEWCKNRWVDDCLISSSNVKLGRIIMEGVVIVGSYHSTEQWTSAFQFELDEHDPKLNNTVFRFKFCNVQIPELSYDKFKKDRIFWKRINNDFKFEIETKLDM
jgi:hypothetical protein